MTEVITEKEVSKLLSISLQSLRNWRCQRKGPPYIKIGRSVRYPIEDLRKYLESRKIEPEAEPISPHDAVTQWNR